MILQLFPSTLLKLTILLIAIVICGAAEELTKNIEHFLQRIPAIDRCDELLKGSNPFPDVRHVRPLLMLGNISPCQKQK